MVETENVFIGVNIPISIASKYHNIKNINNCLVEIESKPHMTFLFSTCVKGLTAKEVYNILQPILKGVSFDITLDNYHVFEKVEDGLYDCLVVKIRPDEKGIELQKQAIKLLEDSGATVEQTFPVWNPHMTIGYYDVGFTPNTVNIEPTTIRVDNLYMETGADSSVNNSRRNYFNRLFLG
jgi:2'-5' RNA ligase